MSERDDELDVLTARLEVAEATAERLAREADHWRAQADGSEAERSRLLASLRDEQRQRAEIDAALGLTVAPLDTVVREIRRLQEQQAAAEPEGEPDWEPVDLVALPSPEDLPAGYLMRVVRWALAQVEGIDDLCERVCGVDQ